LPSLLVVNFPDFQIAREEVSFNLSGPFLLTLSAVYFYNRRLSGNDVVKIFRNALLPLLTLLVYLILVPPNLEDIEFGTESNFQASGGFGPNQVSTVIGIAIFLLMVGLFYKSYMIHSLLVDLLFMGLFVIRGLATFSRGGMIGAVIGGLILVGYTAIASRRSSAYATIFSFLLFAGGSGAIVWNYVNEQTEGRLEYRYEGKNYLTGKQKDVTSGRTDIMLTELNYFYQNPLFGIGPGMGTLLVTNKAGKAAHSHSEYTRLFAEHGIFGVTALLILIIAPLIQIFKLPRAHRPLPMAIFVFVLFTLSHSAMRLAIPGFFYGLCLITPVLPKPTPRTLQHD
jgi:O-antigen ligase